MDTSLRHRGKVIHPLDMQFFWGAMWVRTFSYSSDARIKKFLSSIFPIQLLYMVKSTAILPFLGVAWNDGAFI